VAHGHGGVALQQQQRHRLADDVTPSDDDGLTASDRHTLTLEQLDHTGRRARGQQRPPLHQPADILRMKAVDVLARVDRIENLPRGVLAHRRGQRRLHQNPVAAVVVVESLHQRQHGRQRRRRVEAVHRDGEPGLCASLVLVTHVDVRRRVVADDHDRQRRRAAVRGGKCPNLRDQLGANRRGRGSAIETT
jgi:hypothetical protein